MWQEKDSSHWVGNNCNILFLLQQWYLILPDLQSPLHILTISHLMKNTFKFLDAILHRYTNPISKKARLIGPDELVDCVMNFVVPLEDGNIYVKEDPHTWTLFGDMLLCNHQSVRHVENEMGQQELRLMTWIKAEKWTINDL